MRLNFEEVKSRGTACEVGGVVCVCGGGGGGGEGMGVRTYLDVYVESRWKISTPVFLSDL